MLNVSATQELHRIVQSQAAEIVELKLQAARIADLEQTGRLSNPHGHAREPLGPTTGDPVRRNDRCTVDHTHSLCAGASTVKQRRGEPHTKIA